MNLKLVLVTILVVLAAVLGYLLLKQGNGGVVVPTREESVEDVTGPSGGAAGTDEIDTEINSVDEVLNATDEADFEDDFSDLQ